MLAPLVCLLALGATKVGVRIEDAQGISADEQAQLARQIGRGIEEAIGATAIIDDALFEDCEGRNRCIREIRGRTDSSELVLVQAFGAGTRIRVVAERVEAGSDVPLHRVQVDVPYAKTFWPSTTRAIADVLFAREQAAKTAPAIGERPELSLATQPAADPLPGYLALGGGAIAGGVAIALRVASDNARARVAEEPLSDLERQSVIDSSRTTGLLSNLAFGAAAVLITAGVMYLVTD